MRLYQVFGLALVAISLTSVFLIIQYEFNQIRQDADPIDFELESQTVENSEERFFDKYEADGVGGKDELLDSGVDWNEEEWLRRKKFLKKSSDRHRHLANLLLPTSTTSSSEMSSHSSSELNTRNPDTSPDSFTIVTALFDIGRGQWWLYRRPYEYYLKYMKQLLNLDVNLVVFIDRGGADFVRKHRILRGLTGKTAVIEMSVEQLELYRYHQLAKQIMDKERLNWNPSWDSSMRNHPEGSSAEYDLVVNSKPYFLYLAATKNPFNSTYFYWFDAGYGHSSEASVFPSNGRWVPRQLMLPPANQKLTVVKLVDANLTRFPLEKLYRQDLSLVSGGFLGGRNDTVIRFYRIYTDFMIELLNTGYLDDDQTVLTLLIVRYPDLFNVVIGDWYDAARYFQ